MFFAVAGGMHEDLEQLDHELAALACSLRSGDHMLACAQLGELAFKLDRYISREERALALVLQALDGAAPGPLVAMQREHKSLREMVAAVASALDRADDARAIDIVGKLRSVLLLHIAKEERLLPPQLAIAAH